MRWGCGMCVYAYIHPIRGLHLFLTSHINPTHTTGPDWIPTIDLARLAANPPSNRKGVLRCVICTGFHSFWFCCVMTALLALPKTKIESKYSIHTRPNPQPPPPSSYYARRPALLRQLQAQIRCAAPAAAASTSPSDPDASVSAVAVAAAAEAVPRPFPGPYPEGYTSVVAGGERQQKRWAQLKARLGGEETRRALEEEVGRSKDFHV